LFHIVISVDLKIDVVTNNKGHPCGSIYIHVGKSVVMILGFKAWGYWAIGYELITFF
jgi:hypothetical protein